MDLQTPCFLVTCPRGLAGCVVTAHGTRGLIVGSRIEAYESLEAARRVGKIDDAGYLAVQAQIDASRLLVRIDELDRLLRTLVEMLNLDGTLRVFTRNKGRDIYVVPRAGMREPVWAGMQIFRARGINTESIWRRVRGDLFTTPLLDPANSPEEEPILL